MQDLLKLHSTFVDSDFTDSAAEAVELHAKKNHVGLLSDSSQKLDPVQMSHNITCDLRLRSSKSSLRLSDCERGASTLETQGRQLVMNAKGCACLFAYLCSVSLTRLASSTDTFWKC